MSLLLPNLSGLIPRLNPFQVRQFHLPASGKPREEPPAIDGSKLRILIPAPTGCARCFAQTECVETRFPLEWRVPRQPVFPSDGLAPRNPRYSRRRNQRSVDDSGVGNPVSTVVRRWPLCFVTRRARSPRDSVPDTSPVVQ